MTFGSHTSSASGIAIATGFDFAAANGAGTSGLRHSGASAESTCERESSALVCGPKQRSHDRASGSRDNESGEGDDGFVDRRKSGGNRHISERRQFGSSHIGLSPAAKELAVAIDQYKLTFRRRYITCEEMLAIITQLGYRRDEPT
jgi:hypothetical protein